MNTNKLVKFTMLAIVLITAFVITGCKTTAAENNGKLNIVATTTIVGDVVSNIGGDAINLTILLSPGVDPHSFTPSPQDLAAISDADIVFANGAGLEEFLEPIMESADAQNKVIHVSEGVAFLETATHEEENAEEHEEEHVHEGADPHTWMDPNNVLIWIDNITSALNAADSDNSTTYESNAATYKTAITELDNWVRDQVSLIPEENREIVTDHQLFGYFADRYGFVQIGAIIPSYSTAAETSASDLALLENAIRELGAKAIFIGNTVNPALAEQVSQDTGITLNFIYSGSLSDPDGEAPTYLEYIRYNVNTIVSALK